MAFETPVSLSASHLFAAVLVVCAAAATYGETGPCKATAADVQAALDALETARSHFNASKDNFGPGRGKAIRATAGAIEALQQAAGRPLTPAPESLTAGAAGHGNHPHMRRALAALADAGDALDRAGCLIPGPLDTVRHEIEAAQQGVNEAFGFNPPGSGH